MPITLAVALLAVLAFMLAGVAQSITGFGSVLVSAPLIALVAGVRPTVVAVTLVSLGLTAWAARRERRHIRRDLALGTSVAGFVGLPIGLVVLAEAGEGLLRWVMAAAVLAALVTTVWRVRLPAGRSTTLATGLSSGILLTSTGMNGPPLVMGLAAYRLEPRTFRATLQLVLCLQDLVAVAAFVVLGRIDAEVAALAAIGLAVGPLGWLLGDRAFARIRPEHFRRVLIAGLTASAVLLALQH